MMSDEAVAKDRCKTTTQLLVVTAVTYLSTTATQRVFAVQWKLTADFGASIELMLVF